jgi:hypothetical protein
MDAINWPELIAALAALLVALAGYLKARIAAQEARAAADAAELADSAAIDAHARLDRTDAAIGSGILGGSWSSRDEA